MSGFWILLHVVFQLWPSDAHETSVTYHWLYLQLFPIVLVLLQCIAMKVMQSCP